MGNAEAVAKIASEIEIIGESLTRQRGFLRGEVEYAYQGETKRADCSISDAFPPGEVRAELKRQIALRLWHGEIKNRVG